MNPAYKDRREMAGARVMWNGTVRTLPLVQQLAASATAGCRSLAVTPSDYVRWLGNGCSSADMKAMAADAGVRISHLDPFVRWTDEWTSGLPPKDFPVSSVSFEWDDFVRMAEALEIDSFTAWAGFAPGTHSDASMIDAFGELCQQARANGLRCDLEFIPVSGVQNLATAWRLVDAAGLANAGIVFDFWHYVRSGMDSQLLRRLPGSAITAVQLCDATAKVPQGVDLAFDGFNNRVLPGDGQFSIDEIVRDLKSINGLNNVGVELFSPTFDDLPADDVARLVRRALDHFLPI